MAALLATWRVSELRAGSGLLETLDLEMREDGIGLRRREVAHEPDHVARGGRKLGEAPAPHAGVDLQVHAHALRDGVLRGGDELEPGDPGLAHLALGHRPHDEDAGIPECGSQVERLGERRDAERRGTGFERSLRDVDGAVSVALGLDDGPQLGSARGLREGRGIAADRPEVEGEAGALHAPHSP